MDRSRFTEKKTGQFLQISVPDGHDWAFIPDPLPPNWQFPHELWPLLADAREHLVRLSERGRVFGNPALLIEPLQSREALTSSSLEGTYSSPKELLFELNASEQQKSDKPDRKSDPREVANYVRALRHGFDRLRTDTLPLSKRLIAEMHGLLMSDVRGSEKGAGQFRTRQVHLGSDRRFVPPPPGDVMLKCLDDFEKFMNEHANAYDPLVLSYLVHYQFEAIHPFMDGNGRIGRALLALTTFRWSNLSLPLLYMSAYFERYKDEYISNLFKISTHGDWDTWITFCLRGTIEQCKDALNRIDRLHGVLISMLSTVEERNLSVRIKNIIPRLFVSPVFSVAQVKRWSNTSMPTARADVEKMIETGLVRYLEGERPKLYCADGIFKAAYADDSEAEELPATPQPAAG